MTWRKIYKLDPRVVELYKRGWSCQNIGDEYGVPGEVIRKALIREDEVIRRKWKHKGTDEKLRTIKEMRTAGLSYKKISERLGISSQAVHHLDRTYPA